MAESQVDLFTPRTLDQDQQARVEIIRESAEIFLQVIQKATRVSADQSAAIRKLRELVWTLNDSIAKEKG